jgi:hypothetical protein
VFAFVTLLTARFLVLFRCRLEHGRVRVGTVNEKAEGYVQDDHCGQSGPNVAGDAIAEKKVVEEVLGQEKGENGPTDDSNAVGKNSLEHLTLWNQIGFQHLRWRKIW